MHLTRLTPAHAAQYRALMLPAYTQEGDTFTSTLEEREPLPLTWWAARISDDPLALELVYGAFVDAQLVGVAGLRFECRTRTKHKALLFGMYVQPPFRGRGIGRALVEAVLKHARATPGTQVVVLRVTASNTPAVRLYTSCGFIPYGTEPFANKVGTRFVPILHMWCPVDPACTPPGLSYTAP